MSYRKYLIIFIVCLALLSGCSQEDFAQCNSYADSLLEVKTILSSSMQIGILSIYPTIWAIMVARKILL